MPTQNTVSKDFISTGIPGLDEVLGGIEAVAVVGEEDDGAPLRIGAAFERLLADRAPANRADEMVLKPAPLVDENGGIDLRLPPRAAIHMVQVLLPVGQDSVFADNIRIWDFGGRGRDLMVEHVDRP